MLSGGSVGAGEEEEEERALPQLPAGPPPASQPPLQRPPPVRRVAARCPRPPPRRAVSSIFWESLRARPLFRVLAPPAPPSETSEAQALVLTRLAHCLPYVKGAPEPPATYIALGRLHEMTTYRSAGRGCPVCLGGAPTVSGGHSAPAAARARRAVHGPPPRAMPPYAPSKGLRAHAAPSRRSRRTPFASPAAASERGRTSPPHATDSLPPPAAPPRIDI